MARTKEFDPDAALQAALELFHARGYEATSMSDLVEHLGIGRASIYATFGNKHELYLKAMDRYGESTGAVTVAELSGDGPPLEAVRAVVRRFAAEATTDDRRLLGCLFTNTAAELGPHDAQAARRVERGWEQIETLLHASLERARARGELPEGRDPRALARMLLVLLQGIRVTGKASQDPARIRDAAEQALTLLD
ncbi:TetR/AcrR family transcriptional regulator [Streptomyces sp. VRA16 Mangrove soil]|uniref:TetR/AcrR family transcriptional regulator n=1 Tax=Streptomyces sp. VRA16 Mangrove soil TaxID=2817434 RepID=UPI001A9CCE47|nr:TetR/AcrR family transcriptional regulator [Streptomyces sp. VRA16 Mangrove soil]MBO1336893.1 TetR/AcrR family transcriptional regulator [Streptomyces sp. VRA16 Mangrove soil]